MTRIKDKIGKSLYVALIGMSLIMICAIPKGGRSEDWLRNRVVKLTGNDVLCSGEQVKAPSGRNYILTAGHCKATIGADGSVDVSADDGKHARRRMIEEDPYSDLLLIEGLPDDREGLSIAQSDYQQEHVRTYTHGAGMDTYETRGDLVMLKDLQVFAEFASPEDCSSKPKYKMLDTGFFGEVCIMDVIEQASTAMTVPGSSGGMVVDDSGNLVGVVSAGGEGFSYFATLKDIQRFLSGY